MWFSQNDGAGVRAGRAAEPARPVALPGAESPQGWVHWERLSAKPGHREEESPGLSSWGQEAGWPPSAGCRSACHRRSPRVPGFCPLMGQQGPVTEKMLQSRPHPCGAVAGPVPPRPQEGPAQARCGPPVHRVQQQERRGLQSHARERWAGLHMLARSPLTSPGHARPPLRLAHSPCGARRPRGAPQRKWPRAVLTGSGSSLAAVHRLQ